MNKRYFMAVASMGLLLLAPMQACANEQEDKIGDQVHQELQKKGELLSSSPYYASLNPIARRIKRIADPQYDRPFHFILVHEKDPNAFAVPGGNVYVTDSLMKFVENTEELAGVLCHETSHTIHHDVVNNMQKDQRVNVAAGILQLLLGNTGGGFLQTALGAAANIQTLTYSRNVETAADLKGSETCAEAGYNPWGMVWLFEHFEKAGMGGSMEILSDHPNEAHRISDLENHFHEHPDLFARFSSDIRTAHPIKRGGAGTSAPPFAIHHQPAPADNDVPRFP